MSFNLKAGIDEYQHMNWNTLDFLEMQHHYRMFYRTALDILVLNSCVTLIWRNLYADEYQDIPWRGDVFIVGVSDFINNRISESLLFGRLTGFKALDSFF